MTGDRGDEGEVAGTGLGMSGRALLVPLGLGTLLWLVFAARLRFWQADGTPRLALFDDALISMDYARSLAEGHGLVWTTYGPAVEGYTNPLWTFLMAGLHLLPVPDAARPFLLVGLGAVTLGGATVLAAFAGHRVAPRVRSAPLLAATLVALCYPIVFWSLRGMEVGLFTLLMLAAAVLVLDERPPSIRRDALLAAVVVVGLCTRMDFLVPVGAMVLWGMVVRRGRARTRLVAVLVGAAALTLAAQTVVRVVGYGEILPNTYTLKMTGVPLLTRLGRGMLSAASFVVTRLLLPIGVVVFAWRADGVRRRAVALLGVVVGALVAYSVWVGGDAWEWQLSPSRYQSSALAVAFVALGACLEPALAASRRDDRRWAAWCALVAASLFGAWRGWQLLAELGLPMADLGYDAGTDPAMTLVVAVLLGALAVVAARLLRPSRPPAGERRGRAMSTTATVVAGVVLVLAVQQVALFGWWTEIDAQIAAPRAIAGYASLLEEITAPDATVAVVWAGALPYYTGRPMIDLLGKADTRVAAGPSHLEYPFRPGHDKWDYAYSIGELRPDVIAQLWHPTDDDLRQLRAWGYVPVQPIGAAAALDPGPVPDRSLWFRLDSDAVRWDLVEQVPFPA